MTEVKTYWRTTFGSHKHADEQCANQRRAIGSGYPTVIPADEVSSWAACEFCCSQSEVRESAESAKAKEAETCPNTGVTHPKRINSNCVDCGKLGKVNRSTGKLRSHKPEGKTK